MQPSANPEPPAPVFNHWGLCSALLLAPALRSRQRTAPCELGSHPAGPPATSDPASPCAGLSEPSSAVNTICSQGIQTSFDLAATEAVRRKGNLPAGPKVPRMGWPSQHR